MISLTVRSQSQFNIGWRRTFIRIFYVNGFCKMQLWMNNTLCINRCIQVVHTRKFHKLTVKYMHSFFTVTSDKPSLEEFVTPYMKAFIPTSQHIPTYVYKDESSKRLLVYHLDIERFGCIQYVNVKINHVIINE